MGYWSKHPMGGDAPWDAESALDYLLFTEEEMENEKHYDKVEYAKRLQKKLNEATEIVYCDDLKFVLPFKVVELEIRIQDEVLSQKIKNMIGDGGALERGYDANVKSNSENNYNDLGSPYDYARQLFDAWDDLMSGKRSFDEMGESKGLFEVFSEHIDDGLINTN